MEYVLNFKKNNFFNIIDKVEVYKKVYNKNSFNLVYDKCYLIGNNNDYLFFLKRMTNLIMLGNSVTIKGELNRNVHNMIHIFQKNKGETKHEKQ